MIPTIIHQVWEGKDGAIPDFLLQLSESWKELHPTWEYKLWTGSMMEIFLYEYYSEFAPIYFGYKYNVQRWDVIRYLILYKYGGVYVDLDYECIESMDTYLENQSCCFGLDPKEHAQSLKKEYIISNAWMASEPEHPFFKHIIDTIKKNDDVDICEFDKFDYVLETTGPYLITKLYDLYGQSCDVYLFPPQIISPLSQNEILSYVSGRIREDEVEKKLKEAIALHYFYGSWYNDNQVNTKNITEVTEHFNILYLSTSSGNGGAARAAYRIHKGLLNTGLDSKMLVLKNTIKDDSIYVVDNENRKHEQKDDDALSSYKIAPNHLFSPAIDGIDLSLQLNKLNFDILQLHWINDGFIKIEDLKELRSKIVWRFADCWPVTGGCHYPGKCKGYMKECGCCDLLTSKQADDLSNLVWKRKKSNWENLDLTIVVPSKWMQSIVLSSSLFADKNVKIIPNGLDTNQFSPIAKNEAKLKLNPDKRIILYGAFYAFHDKRKGGDLFLEAIESLASKYKETVEILMFGAMNCPACSIPIRVLGVIDNDNYLQYIYSAADVMVVPSLEEAFGQTAIEALACSTPVVAFSDTGVADVIDHKQNGYLAKYGDVADLAKGIDWGLSLNTKEQDEVSEAARDKVLKNYDIQIIANAYRQLYKELGLTFKEDNCK